MISGRNPQVIHPGGQQVNDTVNGTMAAIVAHMEENDHSDTGGHHDRNEDWLDAKAKDIGGPGGTGSSSGPGYGRKKST